MLRRGQMTTLQERLDISLPGSRWTVGEIATALGCEVGTVRKWRSLGQHQGRTGLSSHMGRPTSGPLSTNAPGMRDAIWHLHRTHPGWGPARPNAN
jgi:hypothetical protein